MVRARIVWMRGTGIPPVQAERTPILAFPLPGGRKRREDKVEDCLPARYAELAVTTNFSFLRGASHPQELVATAELLGLGAIGIADRNSFAGVVRAHDEAKKRAFRLLVGTRLVSSDGFEVLAYPINREAYGRLCRLLT